MSSEIHSFPIGQIHDMHRTNDEDKTPSCAEQPAQQHVQNFLYALIQVKKNKNILRLCRKVHTHYCLLQIYPH